MKLTIAAFVLALIALALTLGHIFMRDSDHGGKAHTFGYGVSAMPPTLTAASASAEGVQRLSTETNLMSGV
jgi:hypothetical protein